MIGVNDVLTWLKQSAVYRELFGSGYCGKLDNKSDRALGVYPLRRGGSPYRAYSGLESYERTGISLLIHYNMNMEQSQYAADRLFSYLHTLHCGQLPPITQTDISEPNAEAQQRRVLLINLLTQSPVFVGTDAYGVYEFVIEFEIYTEKETENHA